MLRVVKRKSHCLVNGHRHRFGGGVRGVAAVDGNGFNFHIGSLSSENLSGFAFDKSINNQQNNSAHD